ncbi:integrase catalytic domain-containing protein [Trichonephila clavipes]|nr:integrase catalytic domain-containing protein [Trichonephila clavipes]
MSTMSQRSHLTDSEASRVVGRIWNRFETGSAGWKTRTRSDGQQRPMKDRYLVLTARRHRNMNATLPNNTFARLTGTTVSTQTVRNSAPWCSPAFSVHPDNGVMELRLGGPWQKEQSCALCTESVRFWCSVEAKSYTIQSKLGEILAIDPSWHHFGGHVVDQFWQGIDYAGPVLIKCNKVEGLNLQRGYIALFVCLAAKAVHIEAVGDLTTDSFIAALRRFSARRGPPPHLVTMENNFVGARRNS